MSSTVERETAASILTADGIVKQFGGLTAVDDVSIHLDTGEILGLIGPNGAGKTTLFNCVSGTYTPTHGTVRLKETDITGEKPHRIAKLGLARTFQISRPLRELTVLENVMVGSHIHTRRTTEARELAREQLEFVGLGDIADREAQELTIGNQKRMELARTLAVDPDVLLIDELMAGLTPTETDRMLELFGKIRDQGRSLLVIEHDMKAIMRISDRVMVLNEGRKIADATPEEVVNDEEVISAYLGDYDA